MAQIKELNKEAFYRMAEDAGVDLELLKSSVYEYGGISELALIELEVFLSKKEFAEALGKSPSEVTKWLSGQHNFTISTLAMLSAFFGKTIVTVG